MHNGFLWIMERPKCGGSLDFGEYRNGESPCLFVITIWTPHYKNMLGDP